MRFAVEPAARLIVPASGHAFVADFAAAAQPTAMPAAAVTAAPGLATVAPVAATVTAPALPATVAPVAATAVPLPAGNATTSKENEEDGPPYLKGPTKILVYGLLFAFLYLAIWYARLPPERRPAAIDEGLMRWIESQEEDDVNGGVNCVLVRVKGAAGVPQDYKPAAVFVDVHAFKDSGVNIGATDYESSCDWETCFVGPLLDRVQNRVVTVESAKPEVKFSLKFQKEGQNEATEFAQATLKPSANASSSSASASSSPTGISRGQWCVTDLKLVTPVSGVTSMFKRVGGSALGTLSVEVKALNVNAAGKALMKSNYYVIAMRNEFRKPFSTLARMLAVALMGMLFLTSLPLIGDMFNGCLYLSIHGLTAASSLLAMSVPHWMKLFDLLVPSWLEAMRIDDLRINGGALASMGGSGIWMALWWGAGEECTNHFWMLEILLCVNSALYWYAWYRGEGGGFMSWFR